MAEQPSKWVLKAILNRCPEEKQKALQQYLPASEQAFLRNMPSLFTEDEQEEEPLLHRVHWSWLLVLIKKYSAEESIFFLHALPVHTCEKLNQELKIPLKEDEEVTPIAKTFLKQRLTEELMSQKKDLLPIQFLPPSPLTPLLHLEKKQLVRLINFLSLEDLAGEYRQIVETKILKKIYSFLSDEEKELLKRASSRKTFFTSRLKLLESWDGQEQSLRILLHKRGLARLAAALFAQPDDVAWYISHRLDIGRGTSLLNLCKQEVAPDVGEAMVQQIDALLKFQGLALTNNQRSGNSSRS